MKKRILLVEDQLGFMSQDLLQVHGDMEITLATQGGEAVDLFAASKFDAVVLDLRLPVLDGFGVLRKIKEIEPNIPVIIVSAWSDQERRRQAQALGAVAFFNKPPNFRDLHRKLLEVMAKQPSPRATTNLDSDRLELMAKRRRLNKLKEQAARLGINAPPEILTEIEDLEDEFKH